MKRLTNLNRRSYFVDKKHFNKAAGVPQLAKNVKYSINNTGVYKRNKYGEEELWRYKAKG